MKDLISVTKAAKEIGCDKATVSRHCKALGLGTKVDGRVVFLTAAEVKKIKAVVNPYGPREKKGKK